MRDRFVAMVESTQDSICAAIEALDGGATFVEDRWERPGGGGGRSRALQEGRCLRRPG